MRSFTGPTRVLGLVCLFVWCSAVFSDEAERMLELYRQSGSAGMEQRLRDYEMLQEMRRARGERHLPAGSQFDFARESFRRIRSEAPGVTGANGCAWTSAGPTNLNGRVISIAIDPKNNQNIYAGTVGGLWRSTTAGRRWQRVSDEMQAMRFSAVALNPGDPTDILAGTGDRNMSISEIGNGLWRSTSSGAPGSWAKATGVFDGKTIYRIRIDPAPPHNVYVAATNGVWIGQHNAGAITFTQLGNFNAVAHDLVIDFSSAPPKIYASVRVASGPFSINVYQWNGSTWDERGTGLDLGDAETISLAMSESHPNILYAKVSQTDGTHVGVYKTITGGVKPGANMDAWKILPGAVPDDIMGWYNTLLEVDPTDPNRVYAGSIQLYMSPDGGVTWDDMATLTDPEYPLVAHGDFHALAFDPDNPKIIYVGNDGGIDRSTDMSQPKWHWIDVAHGMVITMYWNLTSNRAYPTLLAGGTQDNGTGLTFGNRTWYQPWGCDGYDVGSDAANPVTLFANCNDKLALLGNPVNGTPGYPSHILFNNPAPEPPLITDDVTPGAALAAGKDVPCGTENILKTLNGITWTPTNTNFPDGASVIALASAPSGAFKNYLAAVEFRAFDPKACPNDPVPSPAWTPFKPFVSRTDDGGMTWTTVTGLPNTWELPSSVAFDPYDKNRSYVTYRNYGARMYMSTGGAYSKIAGTFPTELPTDVRHVVVDPFNTNVLYAATRVGMFRGEVTLGSGGALPTAKWDPFDEGLPDAMEINDLWIDPANGILTIGSFGFGAFRRDIRENTKCDNPRVLVVRDCVNDDGHEPSPCGGPDPEHPIPVGNQGFYQPDDSYAGSAQWFASRDIRIDVPSKNPLKNQIEIADSVEFELCPTAISNCPAQSMIDSAPIGLEEARVYVQVTNRGVEPVNKTRVIALWAPSAAAFDSLPETFWTKTFPAGGKCGPLDPTTVWQLVDPIEPCRTIGTVTPEMPELARFKWNVPPAANGGAAILTVIESGDDQLDSSIRDQNKVLIQEIVPGSRHIALRNLRIQGIKIREIEIPKMWPLDLLKLPEEMSEVEVVVSNPDLREPVRIVLPAGLTAQAGFGSVRRTRVTEAELMRQLQDMRLDPDNAWELSGDEASLFVDLDRGQRVTTAVIATPADTGATSQVSIVERSRGKIVGGSVMMLRPEM